MKIKYQYSMDKNLVEIFIEAVKKYPDHIIYRYKKDKKTFHSITYIDFYEKVKIFAAGLISLNLHKKKMGIISETCIEWMMSIIANMGLGGIDVPRGNNTTESELDFIMILTDIDFICLQNKESYEKFDKLNFGKNLIKIIFDGAGINFKDNEMLFDDVCNAGKKLLETGKVDFEDHVRRVMPDDICAIIYTSGTTGNPKGVMLSHKNLAYAPTETPGLISASDTDRWMSILPVWHVGERFFEFMGIFHGVTIILSSVFSLKDDMNSEKPHLIPGVPLVWKRVMKNIIKGIEESGKGGIFHFFYSKSLSFIHSKRIILDKFPMFGKTSFLQKIISIFKLSINFPFHLFARFVIYKKIVDATGGCIKTVTSGGGNLPPDVDDFFEVIGFNMINGYGSTETGTLVTIRKDNDVKNTIGSIMPRTEKKIINQDTGNECKPGETGLLFVRGEQIFKGYYKNEKGTSEVLDKDGWFKTGDLVRQTLTGHLTFVGRSKDTIVLLNGENVEPEPLEEILEDSDLISYAVVFGQDKEALSAIIVPDIENLKKTASSMGIENYKLSDQNIIQIYKNEIKSKISTAKGFHLNQLIKDFVLLDTEFTVGVELTNTMKKRRNVIFEKYMDIS